MMVDNAFPIKPLDMSAVEQAQIVMTYCKLFPLILEDFVARKDAAGMLRTDNLIATLSGTAGPVPLSGTATIMPIYDGSYARESNALKPEKESALQLRGQAIDGMIKVLKGA
jgi:hypothetical protein